MTKKITNNFDQWWNDGENKFIKLIFLFTSWWDNGNSKLLKAIFISLALHLVFVVSCNLLLTSKYWSLNE